MFDHSHEPRIRSIFETNQGAIFIGTDEGIFKTGNSGKTWKQVYTGAYVGNLTESNDVMLSTGMRRIIRSTDQGENWELVKAERSVAFDVKQIKGGFAAITAGSESGKRSLKTSYDGGKTWQAIGAGTQDKLLHDSIWRTWNDRVRLKTSMTSIIQVAENFFCTHPDGIFRSMDHGMTWKLVLPSKQGKVFQLFVSGNMIYAIAGKPGC